MTIDSTYHQCCRAIGRRHADSCPTIATAEAVGRQWATLVEAMGPRAALHVWEYQDMVELKVTQLDPEQHPVFGDPMDSAHISRSKHDLRHNTLVVRARTRGEAFRLALSAMAFPPSTGATLRLVPRGGV